MRILVVNPNTTLSMTQVIGDAARRAAGDSVEIQAVSPEMGPVSIEGFYDEAFAVPGLLAEIKKGELNGFDAYVIACFDDTGLDAARCLARGPVIGLCEAGVHCASMIANRFSVVTTLSRSVSALERLCLHYGVSNRCTVRAADVPVLAIEDPKSRANEKIGNEIRKAIEDDGAEAIVLGCAGMTNLVAGYSDLFEVPVLDGVVCAVKLAESLVSLGLRTSKSGGYAYPLPKHYTGEMSAFSPKA